jgi:hypothetical protein
MELEINSAENEKKKSKKMIFFDKKNKKNENEENKKNENGENVEKIVVFLEKNDDLVKSVENVENVDIIIKILKICGFVLNNLTDLDNLLIPRNLLLNMENYNNVKEYFSTLKKDKDFSSSTLTCLHKDAGKKQQWPLLNLVRQILKVKYYRMKPYRKSSGKDASGKKKYIRYFLIEKLQKIL